nr:DUF3566 domain-containing protein [candidate division Zixibacteria bacterium]
MRYELKKVGYWSVIKVMFILNLIVGFIGGLFFAIFMGFILAVSEQFGGAVSPYFSQDFQTLSFGAMILIYPILFSLMGAFGYTLMALIVTFLYNMLARFLGGLEFDLTHIAPKEPIYQQPPTYPPQQPTYQQPPEQSLYSPPPPPPPVQPLPSEMTPRPEDEKPKDDNP